MKKIIFLTLIMAFAWAGCKKLDKFTQFYMDYDSSVDIPATVGINLPFTIYTPSVTTNSSTTFESNNTNKDLVEKITCDSMILTVAKPKGEDFSFLKSIEIYIAADGLDDTKIAWKNDIKNDVGSKLVLETSGADLKEYIMKDEYKLKVTTTTDELLSSDYTIDVHTVLFVDAKILGI